MCLLLSEVLAKYSSQLNVFIGDFNINWLNEVDRIPLHNFFVREHNYKQLVSGYTTDNRTIMDHIFTNLSESDVNPLLLETDFSDHKSIGVLINSFQSRFPGNN